MAEAVPRGRMEDGKMENSGFASSTGLVILPEKWRIAKEGR
jgi:hypothetical protein